MITQINKQITQIRRQITQIKIKQKEIVGINISKGQLTFVVLTSPAPGAEEVKEVIIKKISDSSTDDEISRIMQEVFREKHLFKKEVWLNIESPESKMLFRRLSLPAMPAKEIPDAIKWNLKDKVSLDIKTARLAYEQIGGSQKEDGSNSIDVMAVLVQGDLIDRYLDLFKRIGVALTGINVTPFSILNILRLDKGQSLQEKEPLIICHIGIEYTYLCICVGGKLAFVRQIPVALATILNAMTGTLVSDKGKIELTREDAQKIIQEVGIPGQTDTILGGKVLPGQIIAMVRPVIERFSGELIRSCDYYQREFNSKVERILLTGEGANIKGLSAIISKGLNVNVETLKLPQGLLCPAAAGAAAGARGRINLLPDELKQAKQEKIQKGMLRVSTAAVLGALVFSFLTVSIQITSYRKQLELVRKQKLILKDLKVMQDRISSRQAVIASARSNEVRVDLVLKEFSTITPGNIAFEELWLNQRQRQLKLRGMVSARPEAVSGILSDFMEALEKTFFIKEANLANVEKSAAGAGETSIFEINCVLK